MFLEVLLILFLFFLYKVRKYITFGYSLYSQFKKIVDPDGSKGHFRSIYEMSSVVFQKLGYQRAHPPPEKFNRDYIKISYHYKDKSYFYLLKVKRGVTPLVSIVDEKGEDVMDALMPYLGPNLDCHNTPLSPKDFGYEKITVTTVMDETVVFEENDLISF